jgi:hypothetical protein
MKKTTTSKMKKSAKARTPKTVYVSIGSNVYYDGSSYRVRMTLDGTRVSKNFGSKRNAISYRNQLLKTA